jgi:hypothetical protein
MRKCLSSFQPTTQESYIIGPSSPVSEIQHHPIEIAEKSDLELERFNTYRNADEM